MTTFDPHTGHTNLRSNHVFIPASEFPTMSTSAPQGLSMLEHFGFSHFWSPLSRLVTDFSWVFMSFSHSQWLFESCFSGCSFESRISTGAHGPWGDAHEWLGWSHVVPGILIYRRIPSLTMQFVQFSHHSFLCFILDSFPKKSSQFPHMLLYYGIYMVGFSLAGIQNLQFHLPFAATNKWCPKGIGFNCVSSVNIRTVPWSILIGIFLTGSNRGKVEGGSWGMRS